MIHLRLIIQTVVLLVLVSTALADGLNVTKCYCATPPNQLDLIVEAGCFYLFQYHSIPYSMILNIDYTCRDATFVNPCTVLEKQKQQHCRTYYKGLEFCYKQNVHHRPSKYTFMGITSTTSGKMLTAPKDEVDKVCDHLCMKHVGLPRIRDAWHVFRTVQGEWQLGKHVMKKNGSFKSKIEIFPELPDIVRPKKSAEKPVFPWKVKGLQDDDPSGGGE
ncbi:MAG: hypothetical protein FRX48_06802 [Lasallia pustulata]|uniref:Uncharacterized protein n=1 Tax=Lasallia pustulata TaxID=136370 RepID=A0A5M8PIL7_9LECA|nr:MAG: hypothetical protein FRX48_06802 [Lasallia pustulata]